MHADCSIAKAVKRRTRGGCSHPPFAYGETEPRALAVVYAIGLIAASLSLFGCAAEPVIPTRREGVTVSDAGPSTPGFGPGLVDGSMARAAPAPMTPTTPGNPNPPFMQTPPPMQQPVYDAGTPAYDATTPAPDASSPDLPSIVSMPAPPSHPVPACNPDGPGGTLSCQGYTRCLPALWDYARQQHPGCAGYWFMQWDLYKATFDRSCQGQITWSASFNCG